LTIDAFVTTEALFTLRTDAMQVDFRCRRQERRLVFEVSYPGATLVLRVHDVDPPAAALADGHPLPRLDRDRLDAADRGWAVEGRTTILKARARELRAE